MSRVVAARVGLNVVHMYQILEGKIYLPHPKTLIGTGDPATRPTPNPRETVTND